MSRDYGVAGLVRELRATGVPVGLSEHLDATRALAETDLFDRDELRAALRTTLVKDAGHFATFDLVFDLYFTGQPVDVAEHLAELSDAELRDLLAAAVRREDDTLLRQVVGVLVGRHAGFEPGRAVAGVLYQMRTVRAIDLEQLGTALSDPSPPGPGWARRLATERVEDALQRVQDEVGAEIRRRLIEDRGADAVARTLRTPLPEDVDFLQAAQRDADALRLVIQPLARKLAARLAVTRKRAARGILDFRRTVRNALSTGGVPVEPVFRPRRPAKPRLVVLADISGSVSTFAGFALQLVHALRGEFTAVRSFVFVDGLDEVTDIFSDAGHLGAAIRSINARGCGVRYDGRSDYGHVLRTFDGSFVDSLTPRTTVLVLGDARSNYLEPRTEALAGIAARAGHVYWLNPEPMSAWDSGDSVIGRYAPHCERVVECRSLRQLRAFVESLT
ncbi:vWA domain-containing protein [Actinophytocola oryzae]|uniref:VWA domain containing CoxE-like protein n=1 Tax=Actinophytocola oryzae TaxID=502181 RepID=A0A4R7VFJ4_9PSEU|nr:VWA domain-containing protein [Actinophytocola oryzae]TDV48014.1 hypothetical protein CLV71_109258 [Actinophytocola oryzae]